VTDLAERLAAVAADPTADAQAKNLAANLAAVVEASPDQSTEALAEQLSAMISGEAEAALTASIGPGWKSVGQAAKLQQEAYKLLREADAQAQRAVLAAQLPPIEQARQVAEQEAEALAEAEHVAVGNVRHAEDRQREAAVHARECAVAAEDAALVGEVPQVQTELLVFADKAQQVAAQFTTKLTETRRDHAHALARADAARDLVKELKALEQAAKDVLADAEQHPERAPRSTFTLSLGMTAAAGDWSSLTQDEQVTLRSLVANLAEAVGADRGFRNESRTAGYAEGLKAGRDEARSAVAAMPQRGSQHVLPPGIGRR
jgi:hypothetical protein